MVKKPLQPSEIPIEYRSWFKFEEQFMRPRPGGGKNDAAITTFCRECSHEFPTLISSIRKTLGRGGKLLGLCGCCKRDRTWINEDGYVFEYNPHHPNARADGKILQHVRVMSDHLGRPLKTHEQIHHKNGNRQDNRVSNLELWSTSQSAGQRIIDKLRWAKELIEQYPEEWAIVNGL